MKTATNAVANLINGNNAYDWAEAYTITLLDGTILRQTSLDKAFSWNGNSFSANGIYLRRGPISQKIGAEVSELDLTIIPQEGNNFIHSIRTGALDGATVKLERVFWERTTPILSGVELVTNGGFENGDPPTGWILEHSPGVFERSGVQKTGGAYSAHVNDTSANYGGFKQLVGIEKKTYLHKFNYLLISGYLGVGLQKADLSGWEWYERLTQTGNWVSVSKVVNVGIAGNTGHHVYQNYDTGAPAEFYIDDVSIQEFFGYAPSWNGTPTGAITLFQGNVADIDPVGRSKAEVKVKDIRELLNVPWPKFVYQAPCVWRLYDGGCGKNKVSMTVSGNVAANSNTTVIRTGLNQANGWFDLGVIAFTSGNMNGTRRTIKSYAAGNVTVLGPLTEVPANGTSFTIYPGCDHTQAQCANKFDNSNAFRGFPFIPREETGI